MNALDQTGQIRERAPRNVQVLAVTSGKGGVGKTNVSTNIAVALAQKQLRVLLLDADLGLANVDVLLGLTPDATLADVISGKADINETLLRGPCGLQIVPGASGERSMMDLDAMERAAVIRAFEALTFQPDVLLIDTAAGISASVIEFVKAAHQVLVVVCDEPASITDAYAIIKVLSKDFGVRRFQVITNMTRSAAEGRTLFQKIAKVADRYLDVVLHHLGNVPYDAKLRRAVQEQRAIVDLNPDCWSGRAFRDMAERIRTWPTPDRDDASGDLSFFLNNLLGDESTTEEGTA
ncbi:MAG: MinD/ParA family protein [Pseudomonadota bacterium]